MNIGITGHRHLRDPRGWLWVREEMRRRLCCFPARLTAITSLAIGADQLLASLVTARGGRIRAVLPFADYARTFSASELVLYERFLASSEEIEILRTPGTDEDAYQAAGCAVVSHSDVLMAVWDGLPAKGKGGTGDVFAYALRCRIPLIHLNPITRAVVRHGRAAGEA